MTGRGCTLGLGEPYGSGSLPKLHWTAGAPRAPGKSLRGHAPGVTGIGPKEQLLLILSQRSKEKLSLRYLPRNLSPAEPARVKYCRGKPSIHCSTQNSALAGTAHCKPLLLRWQNWVPRQWSAPLKVTQQSPAKPAPGQSRFSHHAASANSFEVHNQCVLTRGGPWKHAFLPPSLELGSLNSTPLWATLFPHVPVKMGERKNNKYLSFLNRNHNLSEITNYMLFPKKLYLLYTREPIHILRNASNSTNGLQHRLDEKRAVAPSFQTVLSLLTADVIQTEKDWRTRGPHIRKPWKQEARVTLAACVTTG